MDKVVDGLDGKDVLPKKQCEGGEPRLYYGVMGANVACVGLRDA